MSFHAYLDNVQTKTGKSPDELMELASHKKFVIDGKINPETKAMEIVNWLKTDFDLGHGHAMSIVAYFKGKRD